VDKILGGTLPAELPVELPTKIDLVINSKTANALGLTISPALLIAAERVMVILLGSVTECEKHVLPDRASESGRFSNPSRTLGLIRSCRFVGHFLLVVRSQSARLQVLHKA
jgi:hypothetical protein